MLESMSVSKSMTTSVQMLKNMKKNIENITLKDLFEILKKKLLNLAGFFMTSYDVTNI